MSIHTWPDGTTKSTGNAFDWRTWEQRIDWSDCRISRSLKAAIARENAEADGADVATVHGIGRLVIDKANSKAFHVHRPARKGKQ